MRVWCCWAWSGYRYCPEHISHLIKQVKCRGNESNWPAAFWWLVRSSMSCLLLISSPCWHVCASSAPSTRVSSFSLSLRYWRHERKLLCDLSWQLKFGCESWRKARARIFHVRRGAGLIVVVTTDIQPNWKHRVRLRFLFGGMDDDMTCLMLRHRKQIREYLPDLLTQSWWSVNLGKSREYTYILTLVLITSLSSSPVV